MTWVANCLPPGFIFPKFFLSHWSLHCKFYQLSLDWKTVWTCFYSFSPFLFLSQSVTSFSTFSLPGLWVCSLPDTQKTYKHLLSPLTRQNSGICHSVSDLLERTLQLKARRGSGGRGGGGTGYHVTLWDARDAGDVQSQCYPNWVTWEGRKKKQKDLHRNTNTSSPPSNHQLHPLLHFRLRSRCIYISGLETKLEKL